MRTRDKDNAMALVTAATLLIYIFAGGPSPWHWLSLVAAVVVIAMKPLQPTTPRTGNRAGSFFYLRGGKN